MKNTLLDGTCCARTLARFAAVEPTGPALWHGMMAPRMVAHLSDQMRHTLGDAECAPRPGLMRNPVVRHLAIYWLRWPKGRLKGPPEAFVTPPAEWGDDVRRPAALVERFCVDQRSGGWPEHALLGRMSREDWGAFCYKHFDHHLRQFGA